MNCAHRLFYLGLWLCIASTPIQAETLSFGNNSEQPPIVFLGDQDYPPIEWLENGEPRGIFASFLEHYATALDRRIEYRLMNWHEAQKAVLAGKGDVLTVFSPNAEREEHYDFVDSFLTFEISLFVKSDNLTIHNLADLSGTRTGVIKGSFPQKILSTGSETELVFVQDHLDGFRRLLAGEIDALATTKWVGAYIIQKNRLEGIKFVTDPIALKPSHMGVRKGEQALAELLTKGIERMRSDGTLDALNKQWSGYNMVYLTEHKLRQTYLNIALVGVLLFILITLVAINILRKQVKDRTRSLREAKQALEEALHDLIQTQAQLVQSEKMAALGRITAGVAHKINTPIGNAITLNSNLSHHLQLIERDTQAGKLTQTQLNAFITESLEALKLEEAALYKTARLVNDFKRLVAHQGQEHRERFNLFEYLNVALIQSQEQLSRAGIEVQITGDKALEMDSYPVSLSQVLKELIENACQHAFTDTTADQKVIEIAISQTQTTTLITLADNGSGAPDEVQKKMFDPFFTGEASMNRTGLGLSVAHSLINDVLGGKISSVSNPAGGLTLTLELPTCAPTLHLL
ncbi:transporter substrate-binding domain-containing protein [Neptuniibacter halophilus]|uniref:transporter substrate-binding domain-containing protein n=1 Tax=Neptuniibacter halophilus TaxID=651666 RepID=UPI00257428F6|nr:transporter substrate-binding domain-containing protein [Neptuniibacter halophilus]